MSYAEEQAGNQALLKRLEVELLRLEQVARDAATDRAAEYYIYDLASAILAALSSKAILRNTLLHAAADARRDAERGAL